VESRGREGGSKAKGGRGADDIIQEWLDVESREGWGDVFAVMVLTGHDGISVVSCSIKSFLENWRSFSL
jgi:hypothetical protein